MSKAIELEKRCCDLARKIDIHAARNTDDYGSWKTKKAQADNERMQRQLEKLDDEYENSL